MRQGGILNSNDPRTARENCLLASPEVGKKVVDEDLPKNVKKWLTSPGSQHALRGALGKQQHL